MPHSTGAHQKMLRNAGIAPNRAGPDPWKNTSSQTKYDYWGNPVYPEPQSIRGLPPQLAGYTDDFNVAGKVAGTEAQNFRATEALYDFLNKVDTIVIDPQYKTKYDNVGNDPDSAEHVSNYRGSVPIYRMQKLQGLAKGLEDFAGAASKYWDKKVEILRHPGAKSNRVTTYRNKENSLKLRVEGFEDVGVGPGTWAGYVTPGGRLSKPAADKTGKKNQNTTDSYGGVININTNLNTAYSSSKESYAGHFQHEFGHVLGVGHPEGYATGGEKNSVMSYARESSQGHKLGPADINLYRDLYKKADVQRRAKNAYKGVAKKRK